MDSKLQDMLHKVAGEPSTTQKPTDRHQEHGGMSIRIPCSVHPTTNCRKHRGLLLIRVSEKRRG
eukprot:scaffold237983_cov17-Tisochrysis_lutea.AAC.3